MGKSHAVGWASDAPTPAQLKEFFAQIERGRVTSSRLQDFLRGERTVSMMLTPMRAREIMGRNFFGINEAIRYFGVNPSRPQLAALSEVPFTETALEECKETHVLIAVFPMSILDIRGKVSSGQRLFYNQDWYNKEVFAKEKGETEWQLIRKTPADNSIPKTFLEQTALLVSDEETPTARIMVYMIIGHFLATGERLLEKIHVRVTDVDSNGLRVFVGPLQFRRFARPLPPPRLTAATSSSASRPP